MTRQAVVAGQFYPEDPRVLRADVEGYIEASKVEAAPEEVCAVIAPHAGYIYSGPTAGFAYARVKGKQPKRVILLGRSHRHFFEGASVYDRGAFETPLGTLAIDEAFATALATEVQSESAQAHLQEHSIEVQIPFVQVALGAIPIVPILFGAEPGPGHLRFGETLAKRLDPSDLIIASTDLSHYQPEARANSLDKASLDAILSKDVQVLLRGLTDGTCSMCGDAPVAVAMVCASARAASEWHVLDYRTSGQTSGDFERVVGYGAISMEYPA